MISLGFFVFPKEGFMLPVFRRQYIDPILMSRQSRPATLCAFRRRRRYITPKRGCCKAPEWG